ncbi:MAG: hypothetical protein DPW18_20610 [Chloroflexi bacterium]|nr:MAG: hypothetical protein EDM79_18400 [Chloroflexota bacterium]MCE7861523.1 hypothetical protein [Chloroflexi bacterium CFX2]MCK6568674.1 hypothetical protein [Anaerolineales bacterium]MCQ3939421.1 hypothetical protein [Chloroflexota bacterium]
MKTLFRIILLTALIAGVSACAPRETIELVVIGNAFGSNTIPQLYEAALAEDMDAKVNTYSWMKPAASPATYLENLQTETELRKAIKNADAILLAFSPSWGNAADNMFFNDLCGGEDNLDCQRKTTAKAKRDWISVFNNIAELRDGQPVVLRVLIWGDWVYPAYYGDKITAEETAILTPYFHEYQDLQSSTPGVKAALVFPQAYEELLSMGYFQEDGLHFSETGSAAAVDLLRGLGYESAGIEGLADLTVTFNETGCEVTPLEGDVPNPIYIRVENPTDGENAVIIFTLEEGNDAQDVLDFKGDGLPPFVKDFVTHLAPGLNSSDFYEVTLNDGGENYVVCGQDGVGALAVPLILKP